ncbi:MAG: prepilin-type N-terminal cleavage/methylation domain-containing protein [Longimicrobiales bacterium]
MRTGHTLVELIVVLALLAVGAAAVLPGARTWADRAAVLGARESVAALVARARVEAVGRGGAAVHVAADSSIAWTLADGGVLDRVDLADRFGIHVVLAGRRTATVLTYDALGVGRVASETLRFRRGGAEAALIVSGYGRVRRR